MAWVGGRARGGQDGRSNGGGHRARSLPFITEPTSHTTSSPQIRDVLFFSLPSTLFSHAPRQFDRTPTPTPTPRLRPQSPPHRTWDLDLYLDPDLILCCTPSARSLPTHISAQEVVSSLPRLSTTTLLTTDLVCLPIRYPEVCKTGCTRQGHKKKASGAQTDKKPLHRVNFQPSEPSLHIYSSAVYRSVNPSIS